MRKIGYVRIALGLYSCPKTYFQIINGNKDASVGKLNKMINSEFPDVMALNLKLKDTLPLIGIFILD